MNVRIKIVHKPKRNWDIGTVTGRDETRRTIVKPVTSLVPRVPGVKEFHKIQYAGGGVQRDQGDAKMGS